MAGYCQGQREGRVTAANVELGGPRPSGCPLEEQSRGRGWEEPPQQKGRGTPSAVLWKGSSTAVGSQLNLRVLETLPPVHAQLSCGASILCPPPHPPCQSRPGWSI